MSVTAPWELHQKKTVKVSLSEMTQGQYYKGQVLYTIFYRHWLCDPFSVPSALAAILAFIDGTPALTPNLDGITYTLNIKFSPGDGGRYGCRVTDVRTKVNQRMSCDTLSAEFPNLEAGRSYTVRVMRRRGHIRETIRRRVRVPPA